MATVNIEIENGEWQDIITLGELTLTNGQTYKISVSANGESQICIADNKPEDSFVGHPLDSKSIFEYTYATDDVIWVKLNSIASAKAIVVLT